MMSFALPVGELASGWARVFAEEITDQLAMPAMIEKNFRAVS